MLTPANLAAALAPDARAIFDQASGRLDAADALLAAADGLTARQARSRARNARRQFGESWPDFLPATALSGLEVAAALVGEALHHAEPDALLAAAEAAAAALEAPGAGARLHLADWRDLDAAELADRLGVGLRRAHQVRRERLAHADPGPVPPARAQGELFEAGGARHG